MEQSKKYWADTITDVAAIISLTTLSVFEQIDGTTAVAVISIIAGAWLIKRPNKGDSGPGKGLLLPITLGILETLRSSQAASMGVLVMVGRILIAGALFIGLSAMLVGCGSSVPEPLRSPCNVVTAAAELVCAVEERVTSGGETTEEGEQ